MRVHLKHMGGLLLSGLLFTIASAKDLKLDCGDTTVWFSPQNGSITRISSRNETLLLKSSALFSAQANHKEIYPNGAACSVNREGEKSSQPIGRVELSSRSRQPPAKDFSICRPR